MLSEKPLSPREQEHRDAKLAEHAQRAEQDAGEPFDEVAYWTRCYDGYAAQLAAAGAPLLDLRDVFDARAAEDEVFLDALHFGDRGNQWIADALAPRAEALLR